VPDEPNPYQLYADELADDDRAELVHLKPVGKTLATRNQ
jgi:hypothetical protein